MSHRFLGHPERSPYDREDDRPTYSWDSAFLADIGRWMRRRKDEFSHRHLFEVFKHFYFALRELLFCKLSGVNLCKLFGVRDRASNSLDRLR